MGRAGHQVIGEPQRVLQLDGGAARRGVGDLEGVGQRYGLEHGTQLVVAIGAPPEHPQTEVDLSQRAHLRPAERRAHLSYWSSEKTS